MAEPALGLRFDVTIDDVTIGSFTEVEGLAVEYEVFEYEEGGLNDYVHRLPGRVKYPTIRLTRALSDEAPPLTRWLRSAQRSTGRITAFDSAGKKVAHWSLHGVYPVRWTGPNFSATNGTVAKETLELSHDGFLDEG